MKSRSGVAIFVALALAVMVPTVRAQEDPSGAEQPAQTEPGAQTERLAQAENPVKPVDPSTTGQSSKSEKGAAKNIIAAASRDSSLSTFVAVVRAAGLTEKLEGEGPFTVFAPTNEAFAKLPKGMLDDLLEPANRAKLAGILADHVVPGKLLAGKMKTMKAANVSGHDLAIEVRGGVVTVAGAKVVGSDLVAANGVIHAIDTVIQPPAAPKPETRAPRDHPGH